ncbi:hypothetical protein [Paraburkholderia oxyphila]|uniref:hypothetical protein n=1 Tax=Paraburkholderia oxyphila TaxID=614212 RepID=UPI0004866322|nr:hypothetical protein [Paraburkholderia oxyphila]
MLTFCRQSPLAACAGSAVAVHSVPPNMLAAALVAACLAWPCMALAQRAAPGSASATPGEQTGDTLSSTVSREKSDEQRLLGSPGSSGSNPYSANPYSTNGASPDDAEDALTNEKHMHIVTPSDAAASGASATGGGVSRTGRVATSASRIGKNGISRAGNALANGSGSSAHRGTAGYDYGASQTSPTAQVYGNPYSTPYTSPGEAAEQLYKSPW